MELALCLIFFLSGTSALLFETLWFRLAGLTFGNSVWASSMVLASFMGGLALGNHLAGRLAASLRRPLRAYAALEAAIGASGLALVLVFPSLSSLFVLLFRPLLDHPLLLNPLRLGISFVLMAIPTTAMGATLPLLVGTLARRESSYGRLLGRLYGWNTLRAVAGALAGETVLIGALGIRGTGVVAALLNGIAVLGTLTIARRIQSEGVVAPPPGERAERGGGVLLVAAFLSGGLLLALEVVWFRFLLLFTDGTTLAFAVMPAVVLLGIATGGLLCSWLFRTRFDHEAWTAVVALGCGFALVLGYASFQPSPPPAATATALALRDTAMALRLMLPVSILSGVLFTLLGRALQKRVGDATVATAHLTLANTIGAMLGSLVAGFVLLPRLGIEKSIFTLALAYGVAGILIAAAELAKSGESHRLQRFGFAAGLIAQAITLAVFPFGLLRNDFLPHITEAFRRDGSRIVAVREGVTETATYLRRDLWGEPYEYRLVTNDLSMSATTLLARRYMSLFVHLPMAFHPDARRALLISYGVGTTAKALTETRSLQSIDVVDISQDVVDLSRLRRFDGGHPLDDPRVNIHIEDGRFFLLATEKRFDLITAEPPPPKNAGIVNLYSAEYFQLIHDRLAEGGFATYWLPIYQLEGGEGKAVIRAFCSAFADCSLWSGAGAELILMGTRGTVRPASERFGRQWSDPITSESLSAIGVASPEMLGTLFIADAPTLRQLTASTPPLVDDFPQRLSWRPVTDLAPDFAPLFDVRAAQSRFAHSATIRALMPAPMIAATVPNFRYEAFMQHYFFASQGPGTVDMSKEVSYVLAHTSDRAIPLILLGSDAAAQRIADRVQSNDPMRLWTLGVRALSERRYADAVGLLQRASELAPASKVIARDLALARNPPLPVRD
ncbi:MAG TPA: spermidine synthase [Thermoanaerobaculia bacterium]|nr:spermidine synthase [Thermoanaerobaculia bacterium]